MEKFNIPNSQKVKAKVDNEFRLAMSKTEFKNIVKNINIPEQLAKKNVTKINASIDDLKNCKTCKGLYQCKNAFEGHVYYPSIVDDRLIFGYAPCKYQKKMILAKENKETSENVLKKARMKDIDITDKNRVALIKWIKAFYDNYDPSKTQKGLYLHGSFGSGKTYLISALFNELKETKNIQSEIVYYPDLLRSLRDNFDLLESKVEYLKGVELLMLDDIGAENVTSWGRDEILSTILQYRMNEGLTTFFTSNLTIKELESHLAITKNSEDFVKARRIIERVKQLTEDIELISQNKRI